MRRYGGAAADRIEFLFLSNLQIYESYILGYSTVSRFRFGNNDLLEPLAALAAAGWSSGNHSSSSNNNSSIAIRFAC